MNNFGCKKCGACCRTQGIVIIYPVDVVRISSFLSLSNKTFLDKYCRKYTVDLGNMEPLDVYAMEIKEQCVFLGADNLCLINDVKPIQCAFGPKSYFQSIGSWKNCKQLSKFTKNPFPNHKISDDFFVSMILSGY